MGKMILFKEVQEKALDNSLADLVLFGERNFIEDENGVYDLIFHAKQTYPYDKEKPCSLVIPVLRTFNDDEAIRQVYNLNLKHQEFTRYVVSSEFLDFYDVIPKELGREIKHLGKYNVVPEKRFISHIEMPELKRKIQETRRIIDRVYR